MNPVFEGWWFDHRAKHVVFGPDGREDYWFDFPEDSTALEALIWVRQVSQKSWADRETLEGLVKLLLHLLGR